MKKNLGVIPGVYPMPVLMVAAYDENDKVNVISGVGQIIKDIEERSSETWKNTTEKKQ